MANALSVNSVVQALTGYSGNDLVKAVNSFLSKNPGAGKVLNFMSEYLQTAAEGMPRMSGGRWEMPSSLRRSWALAHLRTLEDAAMSDQQLAQYVGLVRHLVNPVLIRPLEYAGPGGARVIKAPAEGTPHRGGVYRNLSWL
jgi:hypothetical protein